MTPSTMPSASAMVATLFTQVSQYHVIEELDPRFQLDTRALQGLYVRSSTTQKLVPLSILASVKPGVAPVVINHQGSLPATTLSFNLATWSCAERLR